GLGRVVVSFLHNLRGEFEASEGADLADSPFEKADPAFRVVLSGESHAEAWQNARGNGRRGELHRIDLKRREGDEIGFVHGAAGGGDDANFVVEIHVKDGRFGAD